MLRHTLLRGRRSLLRRHNPSSFFSFNQQQERPQVQCRNYITASSQQQDQPGFHALLEQNKVVHLRHVKSDGSTKRFYERIGVISTGHGTEHALLIQDRIALTPLGFPVIVPSESLAAVIATEWEYQLEFIRPHLMPVMTLVTTAIDQVPKLKADMMFKLPTQLKLDNVLMRHVDEKPVYRLQKKKLEPLRKWAEQEFQVRLNITESFLPVEHAPEDINALLQHVEELDDFRIAVFDSLGTLTCSSIIPLALMKGKIDVNQAFDCARVEENYQIGKYGRVEGFFGHGLEISYAKMKLNAGKLLVDSLGSSSS